MPWPAQPNRAQKCGSGTAPAGGLILTLALALLTLATQTAEAQTYTVLHKFRHWQGGFSTAGLIQDEMGNFYGTAQVSGKWNNGTVFKVKPNGSTTVLHAFTGGADGKWPAAGLVRDASGNMYGTTMSGGDPSCQPFYDYSGCGTVFKVSAAGEFTVIHSFS